MAVSLVVMVVGCSSADSPSPTSGSPSVSAAPAPSRSGASSPTAVVSGRTAHTADPCASPPGLGEADHHAYVFAPLSDPDRVISVGHVGDRRAWSTSKVLVVAAYLDTRVGGDPAMITAADQEMINAALTRSDADAITAVRSRIVGRPGAAMTRVLRAIGDETTRAPDSYQGTMIWSLREQVRFMAALQNGQVVSRTASAYLLDQLRPITAHRWGLGTVGATRFKGGWLRADTATRQMGLLDGYAVAISTDAGPAVRQSDGDSAHVREIDATARALAGRLEWQKTCGR